MNTDSKSTESIGLRPLVNEVVASQYVGLGRSSMKKNRVHGTGPLYIKLGRSVRYRIEDLDAWIEKNVRNNTIELPKRQQKAQTIIKRGKR
jgi:predicted DNA-binding transcriptional regulator AlpA